MANMEIYEDAHFDSYGVGENLITSRTDPVFGGVYKLVAVKEKDGSYTPKMKCSESSSKAIIPGKLMAYRFFDEEDKGQCDVICLDDEVIEILSLGIAFYWLSYKALNSELLKNVLNSKDYYYYSPANLLKEVQTLRKTLRDEFNSKMRQHSYNENTISTLKS